MELRSAPPSDAALMSWIHALSWKSAYRGMLPDRYLDTLSEDYWTEAFAAWLETGTTEALLAFEGGRPAGCSVFGPAREEAFSGWGEVITLYLLPEAIGTGAGSALFSAALRRLDSMGFSRVTLWALRENARARRFYERFGFCWNGDRCFDERTGIRLTDLRYVREQVPPVPEKFPNPAGFGPAAYTQ